MNDLNLGFDTSEVTDQMESEVSSFSLIPEGNYNFVIERARNALNKKQDGAYLELTCLLEGTNRKLWIYYNLKHINPKVENMAKVDLKKLMIALKIKGYKNPEELVGKVFNAQIEHQKTKEGKYQEKIIAYDEYIWDVKGKTKAITNNNNIVDDEDVPF